MSIGRAGVALEPQSDPADPASRAAPGPAALLAWAAARDAVLRGLVHALSNRVGTVVAVSGMLDGAPAGSVGTAARVLGAEAERLEALVAHFRLATADPFGADAAPEPVHVPELLAAVAALAGAAEHDAPVAVAVAPGVPPAVAGRAALAQALLVLARATAASGRDGADGELTLRAAAADGQVVLAVERVAGGGELPADARAACAWLLGDAAVSHTGPAVLRLPALGAS